MNYGLIKYGDDVNADGMSVTLFPSGCRIGCLGCFNKEAQDENYGQPFTEQTKLEIFNYFTNNFKYIDNLCIIGGHMYEDYNYDECLNLIKEFKEMFQSKKVIVWTGYEFDYIFKKYRESLDYIDILCDGRFEIDKFKKGLKYVGSTNQLVYDVQETLKQNKKVLYFEN